MVPRFAVFSSWLPDFCTRFTLDSKKQRRKRPTNANNACTAAVVVERLEQRSMLSAVSAISEVVAQPNVDLDIDVEMMATSPGGSGYTPQQLRTAYGFDLISQDGTGQTIAIIGAYHNPTIADDLKAFNAAFGIADPPSFKVISQTGSTTNLPPTDPNTSRQNSWAVESALDVQWAHAMAPGANIILVEANSAGMTDLLTAVRTAASIPEVSVVSMSWSSSEFAGQTMYDSFFTTPAGHQGVTFVASSGDWGAPAGYPAYSPNVLAVGGTTLNLSSSGAYLSESAWSGSGGGISKYASQPSYQTGTVTQTTTQRAAPDVAFDADPNTGVPVYSSYSFGASSPWARVGGTSLSAPAWGAAVAIIDQARVQNGLGTLNGKTETLPMLYQLSSTNPSAFNDIVSGSNGYSAEPGYDLVTGLGSPVMDVLVPAMAGTAPAPIPAKLVVQSSPSAAIAGQTLGTVKVAVAKEDGQVLTSSKSTVRLTITSGPGSFTSSSVTTATVVNGVATFSNLTLTKAGTYTIQVTDNAQATSTSFQVTISAAAASKLAFQQFPTSGTVGTTLGTITVAVQDKFGNAVTTYNSNVIIAVYIGSATFAWGSTTTVSLVNGVGTFSNLMLNTPGTYTLIAIRFGLTSAISSPLVIGNKLSVPQNVSITATGSTTAQLTWNAATGTQGYRIYQVIGSQRSLVSTVSSSTLSLQITGLTAGSSYSFFVEAFSGSNIADSQVVSITMPASNASSLTVSARLLSSTSAHLTWTAITGAAKYNIYYTVDNRTYMLGSASSTTSSASVYGVAQNVNISYQVQAVLLNSILYSNWATVNTANYVTQSLTANMATAALSNEDDSGNDDDF